MKNKTVYMIRRKSDGLFSTGGTTPRFTKNGKIWGGIGPLKNHLNQAIHAYATDTIRLDSSFLKYVDCEVVEIEVVHNEKENPFSLKDYFMEKMDKEAADRVRYNSLYRKGHNEVTILYPDGTEKVVNPINDNGNVNG